MDSNKKTARIAGLWYLCIAIFYSFSMIYVDSVFYVPGDTLQTVKNILGSGLIYRLGFVSCLLGHVCFLFLANALYKLFKPVNRDWARIMVLLIVVGVSVAFLNRLNQITALLLINGGGYLAAFELPQLQALAMMSLDIHRHGEVMAAIFWGLWLLPLGILIIKSNFIPKFLGIFLITACVCYLTDFTVYFFFPAYMPNIDTVFSMIETVAEVAFILWLLIIGVWVKKPASSDAMRQNSLE